MDHDNVPYIIGDSPEGTHVKRLEGTFWENVGNPNDNARNLYGSTHSLAFSSTGTPYIAFKDGYNGYRIALARYSGTAWKLAKSSLIGTQPEHMDLTMGADNRLYLAFQDFADMGNYVLTTDPTNYSSKWDTLGSGSAFNSNGSRSDFKIMVHFNQILLGIRALNDQEPIYLLSSSEGRFTSIHSVKGVDFDIAASATGDPYLAYISETGNQVKVIGRFNSTWIDLGAVHQSADIVRGPSLAVTREGVPYVGFHDVAAEGKPSVIRASFDPDQ